MKILRFIKSNFLFVFTLFLLAFIPLYPKLPLIGVTNTWVYVRAEDFLVLAAAIFFLIQFIRKKISINSYLTVPILLFWGIGLVSTVFAIFVLFPTMANVFPHVAILNYLRRIEYLSLFFIAYASIKEKRFAPYVIAALTITLLLVAGYGIGQRIDPGNFLAYSTMNEEFAKGIPLKLSPLGRIQATFAGHYDLAAYLVLLIPIMGSLVFGYKKFYLKILYIFCTIAGLVVLLMTASRVSFAVYIVSISFMLLLQKQKKFIIPVVIASILLLNTFQGISSRFNSTISQVDLVVDARTGKAVGVAKNADASKGGKQPIIIEDKQLTGENLPQGSGYINLPAQGSKQSASEIVFKRVKIKAGAESTNITNIQGDFVVRKVLAYDVSFTTRFQGEWPRAMEAFKKNILLGTGYSSISLATDNNYLRALGETGALGLGSFILIFIIFGISIYKVLPHVESKEVKSLIIGVAAGVFGLSLNAVLIDVFEASKVAYVLWLLVGISVGFLHLYQKERIDFIAELKKVLLSTPLIVVYLLLIAFSVYAIIFPNYFVGNDFTWLRWAADCKKMLLESGLTQCESAKSTILHFFTSTDGSLYRPATKLYFYIMYAIFWLNNGPYHFMSILLHAGVASLAYMFSLQILKKKLFAFVAALCFLVLSGQAGTVMWISATGTILATFFIFLGLLLFVYAKKKKNNILIVLSLASCFFAMLFHEVGIVAPLLLVAYAFITERKKLQNRISYVIYLLPSLVYLALRYKAGGPWIGEDYSNSLSYIYYVSFALLFFITYLLQLFYQRFTKINRYVALVIVFGITALFCFFNIAELNRLNKDWKNAGDTTNNLLIDFNTVYAKTVQQNPVFFFVNTPAKTGQAWLFPAGPGDALWFTFQNENLTVHTANSLSIALDEAEGSSSAKVFEFDKSGSVEEVTKTILIK